jgi:hypothetical protein
MRQRVAVRLLLSLAVCASVGLGLAISADATRWEERGAVVVTMSSGTVEGRLRGMSDGGLDLVVGERAVTIPWSEVARLSFDR